MRSRAIVFAGVLVAAFLGVVPGALAQIPTGNIDGRVTDTDGVLLPGVSVLLSGPALLSDRTAATGSTGAFRFMKIAPSGEYTVTFSHIGFDAENSTISPDISPMQTSE